MIATTHRVPMNTPEQVNQQIRRWTEANVAYYANHRDEIDLRLRELDEEWDIERTLEANGASLALVGTVFGTLFRRRWYVLPLLVGGFLLQHAVQGWCPPIPLFRRLGVRTAREIETERVALKAIRGDFRDVDDSGDPVKAVEASEHAAQRNNRPTGQGNAKPRKPVKGKVG